MKKSKATFVATVIILGVLLVVLNVVTFVAPIPKVNNSVFYTSYGFAEGLILAEGILVLTQLGYNMPERRVLGLPIIYSGFLAMLAQAIVTFVFYLTNAFVAIPIWVVIVIECLLVGFFTIQITLGFLFKAKTAEYKQTTSDTRFMDEFRARLGVLVSINKNDAIAKDLEELQELARGSDPVSNEKTIDSEENLLNMLGDLDRSIKQGNEVEVRKEIASVRDALIERNIFCKAGK